MSQHSHSSHEVTRLLIDWSNGDQAALGKLLPLVYGELRRLAHRYMDRERPDHVLQTTALVNEAYLQLVEQNDMRWQNRAHFFGIAARLMRQILVDYARQRKSAKRGGNTQTIALDEVAELSDEKAGELVVLHEALNALEEVDTQQSRIVELRFFGGLTIEETAEVLGLSPATVKREWAMAKAWLFHQIGTRDST